MSDRHDGVAIPQVGSNGDLSIESLKAGDRSEFARLVDMFSNKLYRLALKIVNDPQDADDVIQETFLKVFRHIGGFDGRSSLSTWLYRIATNEALMALRRRRMNVVSIDEPGDDGGETDQEPLQIVDWCCLPENELMSSEAKIYLDQAISDLPHNLRVVFLLRDIEHFSTSETAQIMDLTETAVKTRLSRGRLQLRQLLSGYYRERMEKKSYGNP